MINTGLLILTNPARFTTLLPTIKQHVSKTLYIQYFPEKCLFISGNYAATPHKWKGPKYSQIVTNLYAAASSLSSRLDIRVLLTRMKDPNLSTINTKQPVELVIFDQNCTKKQADNFIQDCLANTSMGCSFITFNTERSEGTYDDTENSNREEQTYRSVILGGTFDRLHNGHKIFLSEAVLRSTEKVTVGVTDTNMLTGKLLWELIEPCSNRITGVKEFLGDVDPSLAYDVVPINDMYGPTKSDPTLEMLVVSEETERGGIKVNQLRSERNLKELDIHVVKLLADEFHKPHEESKISSSNHRIRLLGTRRGNIKCHTNSLKPYVIGLTGGIASGKSSVAEKLKNLGAALVDCDKLAHDLYLPGKECYNVIMKHFGLSVIQPNGFIDRKALGDIVFNDKGQLTKLNELVWPVILETAKREVNRMYTEGSNIIVMEAAVLIQANWQHACHEIWTCIIPVEEAIKRTMERNNLTEKEVRLRIDAQPSNTEQVNEANVVICTLWTHEVTQKQVENAWNELMEYLSARTENCSNMK